MKNILVGVTGGIAAYKAANFVSLLKKRGYDVKVVMTEHAKEFITPLTLESLSQHPVASDMWHKNAHYEVEHISMAKWADAVVVYPTTYNLIGKVASGIADDLLTTILAATKAEVFFALAMNTQMYENPILWKNIDYLKSLGYHVIEAAEGLLACRDTGRGKLEKEEAVIWEVESYFMAKKLGDKFRGKKLLLTGGPTEEVIDPIRYVSNRSSGRMAYALAKAAVAAGAEVSLISGPTNLEEPRRLKEFKKVGSALEMYQEVDKRFADCDIFISCAAVGDYRPKEVSPQKVKKQEGDWKLQMERNPDILASMGARKEGQYLVGFAAETENLEENAQGKLKRKNLDVIVANDARTMSQATNSISILKKDGRRCDIEDQEKDALAYDILAELL